MQILLSRLKFFTLVLFAAMMVACGGGGEGTNPIGGGTGGDTGGDDGGDVGGDDGDVSGSGFSLSMRIYEENVSISGFVAGALPDTNTISSVSSIESGLVVVGLTDSDGNPVPDIVSVTTSLGTLSPSSGSILTNSNGVAALTLQSGSADSGSAGQLTAAYEGFDTSLNFSVGSVNLKLGRDSNADADENSYSPADYVDGEIANSISSLSPTGSTELTVVVVDSNDELFSTPVTVNFTSVCAELTEPLADLDSSVTTVGGVANSTYTAAGCPDTDTVTATISEVPGVTATGTVNIETASPNSIVFLSADPETIALQGTGGAERPETSVLTFEVTDTADLPAQGETVSFELSTSIGGITLTDTSGITNASGQVSVGVNAGTVPTSVRVTANLDLDGNLTTTEDILSTVSDSLAISTGLPDNDSFSLEASIRNPGGFDSDGAESVITVRAADAFENPAPEGTVINFTSEYGRIESSCSTVGFECEVTWNSQNPKAPEFLATGDVMVLADSDYGCDLDKNGVISGSTSAPEGVLTPEAGFGGACETPLIEIADPDFPGQIFGGHSTILATAIGEESFTDDDGDGLYDLGEKFTDLTEAFIDHNDDGVFGNPSTDGACIGVGVGVNIPNDVVDINDIDDDGDTTELIGEVEICANWQEGGAEEEFVDFNSDGIFNYGNGLYNGSLCLEADELAGDCSRDLVNVRFQYVLNAGGNTHYIALYNSDYELLEAADPVLGFDDYTIDLTVVSGKTIVVMLSDVFNGRLPLGTSVETFDVAESEGGNCNPTEATWDVLNTSEKGPQIFAFGISADGISSGGRMELAVTVPAVGSIPERTTTYGIGCID